VDGDLGEHGSDRLFASQDGAQKLLTAAQEPRSYGLWREI
jgi:hypothetical protein